MHSKKELKKFLKRYKYLVYIVLFFVGVILLNIAFRGTVEDKKEYIFSICLGVGSSIIATAIGSIFLQILLPEDNEQDEELKEWGLQNIYEERGHITIDKNNFPSKNLDFIAFGLSHFRNANKKKSFILAKLNSGLKIRILTINPNSIFIDEQMKLENPAQSIKEDINELLNWANTLKKTSNNIEIKVYDTIPLNFYCRCDETVYFGPYLPDRASGNTITFKFARTSKAGLLFSDIFEAIWNKESNVSLIDTYKDYYVIDHKRAMQKLLEFFCNKLQNRKCSNIIAVVAIFKGNYRRTFFSCNKESEKNKCHDKKEGTVGILLKCAENNHKCAVFSDYSKNIVWKRAQLRNSWYIQRTEMQEETPFIKTENSADTTKGIIAVPLWDREEKNLIGVLTFDYNELPKEYLDEMERNDIDEQKVKGILERLLDEAYECGVIASNFLGQKMDLEYQSLYQEEWDYD